MIKLPELGNYWSNKMDQLAVFVKSSYQRDLCLTSLVIMLVLSSIKKQKSIKPFSGKVGQRHVIKISGSCPMLDDEILPLHSEI